MYGMGGGGGGHGGGRFGRGMGGGQPDIADLIGRLWGGGGGGTMYPGGSSTFDESAGGASWDQSPRGAPGAGWEMPSGTGTPLPPGGLGAMFPGAKPMPLPQPNFDPGGFGGGGLGDRRMFPGGSSTFDESAGGARIGGMGGTGTSPNMGDRIGGVSGSAFAPGMGGGGSGRGTSPGLQLPTTLGGLARGRRPMTGY